MPLAERKEDRSIMRSDDLARLIEHIALRRRDVVRQKFSDIHLADKAKPLAIALFGGRQIEFSGKIADLRLWHASDREDRS